MASASEIQEHTSVVGSDGSHVGTVDHVQGDRIKLARSDPSSGSQHHYIGLDLVGSASGQQVQLNCTAEEARSKWTAEDASVQARPV
jgi:hypothetical protein